MRPFPNNRAGKNDPTGSLAGHSGRRRVSALFVMLALFWAVGPSTAQEEPNGDAADPSTTGNPVAAVEETLSRIDDLLAQFDARIAGIRGQAEEMLDRADAAADPAEQMRFEELYGRMMATAQGLEDQRSRLRQMRDDLAGAVERTTP